MVHHVQRVESGGLGAPSELRADAAQISDGPPGHVNCGTCSPNVSRRPDSTPDRAAVAAAGRVSEGATCIGTTSGVTSCTPSNGSPRMVSTTTWNSAS